MHVSKSKQTVIKANRSWWDLELKDLIHYRDLAYLLIRRDIVTSYKQTILGPIWVIANALIGSAVFTIIFGNIAGLSTDGNPVFLFYLCGNIAWQYFGNVFASGSNALQANAGLFSKVYFPRLIPPISQAISSLINFFVQLTVLLIGIAIYKYQSPSSFAGPSLLALIIPLLVFQSALLGLGMGFIISAVSVKYRDLARLGTLLSQFIMYASPVIYPVSEVPEKFQPYLAYNPLTFIVESYRFLLLGKATACTFEFAIPSICITVLIFGVGLFSYNKIQRKYIDYL
jgi:lipopolysaccharide transport system permease protein